MFAKFVKNYKLISSKQGFVESYATGLFPYPFYTLSIHQKISGFLIFSAGMKGKVARNGLKNHQINVLNAMLNMFKVSIRHHSNTKWHQIYSFIVNFEHTYDNILQINLVLLFITLNIYLPSKHLLAQSE